MVPPKNRFLSLRLPIFGASYFQCFTRTDFWKIFRFSENFNINFNINLDTGWEAGKDGKDMVMVLWGYFPAVTHLSNILMYMRLYFVPRVTFIIFVASIVREKLKMWYAKRLAVAQEFGPLNSQLILLWQERNFFYEIGCNLNNELNKYTSA